ncbi:formylglycine-generating enzyme family protein [bacterium]|nr:formylglycine-generating enzyme family protein [bacterium]
MTKLLNLLCIALISIALNACNNQPQSNTPAATKDASDKPPAASPAPSAQSKTVATPTGEMALIPAGSFTMGDDSAESADEKPAHMVSVAAFYMDTREVTQKQYEDMVKQNPSKYKGPERPVEQVDWYHAALYCNARSRKEGLKPCYDHKTLACDFSADGYRLPTEAEWEYACRAGSTTKYSFGDDANMLKNFAWYKANSNKASHPVGQKSPNAFGLYDMHGNVAEWCQDVYGDSYYQQKAGDNPKGPTSGDKRALRGGGWSANDDACRSTARNSENARFADACFGSDAYGFRCVKKAMQ